MAFALLLPTYLHKELLVRLNFIIFKPRYEFKLYLLFANLLRLNERDTYKRRSADFIKIVYISCKYCYKECFKGSRQGD